MKVTAQKNVRLKTRHCQEGNGKLLRLERAKSPQRQYAHHQWRRGGTAADNLTRKGQKQRILLMRNSMYRILITVALMAVLLMPAPVAADYGD